MKASILMATLGRADWDKYLPSLLNQSIKADEVIIVFDRETSAAEQEEFRAQWPQFIFIFNDINLGITASLNRGLYAAKGDYIFRADDDDLYRSDRIEKQLACFQHTDAELVASWATVRLGAKLGVRSGSGDSGSYLVKCPLTDSAIKQALKHRNILVHPSLAFRREAILALGGYDESFYYAQDYGLYLASIRAGYKFAVVPEALLEKGMGENNITVKNRYRQMLYSCAARVLHHAHSGDRIAFLQTILYYTVLVITPSWLRGLRRKSFAILGRGR